MSGRDSGVGCRGPASRRASGAAFRGRIRGPYLARHPACSPGACVRAEGGVPGLGFGTGPPWGQGWQSGLVGSRGWLAVGAGWQVESGRWWVLGRCLDRAARWLSSVRGRAEGVGLSCRVSRPGRQGRVFRSGFRGGCPARATGAAVVGDRLSRRVPRPGRRPDFRDQAAGPDFRDQLPGRAPGLSSGRAFDQSFGAGCSGSASAPGVGAGHRAACSGLASGPRVWAWLPDRMFGPGFRTACSGLASGSGVWAKPPGQVWEAASASGTQGGLLGRASG
jgi:hypothetical protein